MRFSTTDSNSASPSPATFAGLCDECGQPNTDKTTVVLGFGNFHPECTSTCPDGWVWPTSMLENGEVLYYCGGCALASGRDLT